MTLSKANAYRCADTLSCRACPLRHCFAMPPLPKGEALASRDTFYWTPDARQGAKGRALLQRAGPSLYNLSVSLRSTAPLVGEPLAKPFTLRGLPRPLLQGATATTAASGGNREELLGPRPAGCERQRSRRWEPQPGQWHRVSDDGEVVLRQSLSSVGKSGSWPRFLYLFVEVYAILVLRFIPPILLGKGGVPDDSYPHDFGVCRSRCNVALHLQVA